MIPSQTFEDYPLFGGNATKVAPGDAKRAAGFQQADVLPAEWMNWAWNKNSKGIADLNAGLTSVEAELNNVLSEAGITPNAESNNQLFKAVQKNNGCIMTAAGTPTTITNAPAIEAGNVIKIMFGADVTGADLTTGLLISYNGTSYPVKVCKDGTLVEMRAHELTTGSTPKYIQANTILEFVFDGLNFVVVGNPLVLSSDIYKVYADYSVGSDPIGVLKMLTTDRIPYGWAEANGQAISRTRYKALFDMYSNQTYDGTHTLLSRYGVGDGSTTFNVPDTREVALVGRGTNAKDPIATHDAFTLGEFADDQFQNFTLSAYTLENDAGSNFTAGALVARGGQYKYDSNLAGMTFSSGTRRGAVTRGKRKGIVYIVKIL